MKFLNKCEKLILQVLWEKRRAPNGQDMPEKEDEGTFLCKGAHLLENCGNEDNTLG